MLLNEFNGFDGEKITNISCGGLQLIGITESGHIFRWSENGFGKFDMKIEYQNISTIETSKPEEIFNVNTTNLKFEKVSCGNDISLLLTNDGDIYEFENYQSKI